MEENRNSIWCKIMTNSYLTEVFGSKTIAKEHIKKMDRQVLTPCPYKYYEWDANNWMAMKSKVSVDCNLGTGKWCKKCHVYARHQYQKGDSKNQYERAKIRRLENMQMSGKVPWKRPKVNFQMTVVG